MKHFLFFLPVMVICPAFCFAQKPLIDSSVFDKWPALGDASISNDGRFVLYTIENRPVLSRTIVIQPLQATWKIELPGCSNALFTPDSKYAVFTGEGDTLGIVSLDQAAVNYISPVSSFKIPDQGTGEWLAYQMASKSKELVLRNLISGTERRYNGVLDYFFSPNGNYLFIVATENPDRPQSQLLQRLDLKNDNKTTIWNGSQASNFLFDAKGGQLAFVGEDTVNGVVDKSIWYYKTEWKKAEMLANKKSPGIGVDFEIGDIKRFSKEGNMLFFSLKRVVEPLKESNNVKLDVWSYNDAKLQSEQLLDLDTLNVSRPTSNIYAAVIHIQDHRIVQLEGENDVLSLAGMLSTNSDDDEIIIHCIGDAATEWNWNKMARESIYLVGTRDGTRKLLTEGFSESISNSYRISPDGKYVIYYDPKERDYYSYTISSGIVRNITRGSQGAWTTNAQDDVPESPYRPISVYFWLKGCAALLIYDQHDIFQVDPVGRVPPINITNGYGRRNHVVFRLAIQRQSELIDPKKKILLNAFDENNKNDGFYSVELGKGGDPEMLTMQPVVFKGPDETYNVESFTPIRARNAEMYLVRQMSASQSPNYFYTTDFKTFTALSDIHPEKAFNWLTSELITWKTTNGSLSQGILYKPENFDPKRKYPIIFYYYEKISESLYAFIEPEVSHGTLNIAFYVSNGYLVFTPDIHYTIGHPGQSVVNSVVSAAEYLAKMPWVDSNKMGIQGHSRGGFETNYLVTHTNIFAAAMSACGMSDYISLSGGIRDREVGNGRTGGFEFGSQRIGATLWQRPDLYIENSPIFRADSIVTPLLMVSNKEDSDVPFLQGIEFFTALRRLGKKAWLLQYDGQGHDINGKPAEDMTIRMKQFFDHYLKGAPAPKWMVEGIPASRKGIDDGLRLEPPGIVPGPGLLIPEEQKKVNALQKRKPIKVTIE